LNILVSGITGSLGTALSNYYLLNPPDRLCGYSRDWQKQTALRNSLGNPDNFRWFIGDIRDTKRLKRALSGVDVVIHAAALKDIVTCEYEAIEAKEINTDGTQTVIETAKECGVSKVLVISTDKAAAPINTYGGSKFMAERIAIESNVGHQHSKTKVSVCRYGNVYGSSGSVVPLFKRQALEGTVTITDKKMTRFWIEMEDAVKFIVNCVDRMVGGEIFIPKIKSARVVDVATAIAPGAHQAEIGMRPGEKLHEVLITEHEATHTKEFDDHFIIEPEFDFWETQDIGGNPLPKGFSYTSSNNKEWLSVEDIRGMI
jgi:UDP-N-acetylglucosamine 4,6-dehydratase